jgi:hypothetical protein
MRSSAEVPKQHSVNTGIYSGMVMDSVLEIDL